MMGGMMWFGSMAHVECVVAVLGLIARVDAVDRNSVRESLAADSAEMRTELHSTLPDSRNLLGIASAFITTLMLVHQSSQLILPVTKPVTLYIRLEE